MVNNTYYNRTKIVLFYLLKILEPNFTTQEKLLFGTKFHRTIVAVGKDLLIIGLMKNTNIKIKQYKPNLKKTKHKFRFKVHRSLTSSTKNLLSTHYPKTKYRERGSHARGICSPHRIPSLCMGTARGDERKNTQG